MTIHQLIQKLADENTIGTDATEAMIEAVTIHERNALNALDQARATIVASHDQLRQALTVMQRERADALARLIGSDTPTVALAAE